MPSTVMPSCVLEPADGAVAGSDTLVRSGAVGTTEEGAGDSLTERFVSSSFECKPSTETVKGAESASSKALSNASLIVGTPTEESMAQLALAAQEVSSSHSVQESKVVARMRLSRLAKEERLEQQKQGQFQDDGAGIIICVSVPIRTAGLRIDMPSKTAGFIYHLDDYYGFGSKPTYEPEDTSCLSQTVAVYEMGRKVDLNGTRDLEDWIVRELQGDGVDMPHQGIVRYNHHWAREAKGGRDKALALANAHVYVSNMLRLYKSRLHVLWKSPRPYEDHLIRQFEAWYLRASTLHVPRVSLMQAIGKIDLHTPRWVLCEQAHELLNTRYVHEYCFRDSFRDTDPWKELIFAFIHWAYEKSGGGTLVGQLDCDEGGIISNVVCFNNLEYYLKQGDSLPFFHFKGDHRPCNHICKALGLTPFGQQ